MLIHKGSAMKKDDEKDAPKGAAPAPAPRATPKDAPAPEKADDYTPPRPAEGPLWKDGANTGAKPFGDADAPDDAPKKPAK